MKRPIQAKQSSEINWYQNRMVSCCSAKFVMKSLNLGFVKSTDSPCSASDALSRNVLNWLSDVIALNFVARSASTAVRLSFSLLSTSWWRQYESGGFKRGGLEMFETRSATIAVRLSSSLMVETV